MEPIGPKGKKGVPWSFTFDIADALVNKPKDERQTGPVLWREYYGDMWPADPPYPPNALKIYHIAADWAMQAWDEAKALPGETLTESLDKARYNSWTSLEPDGDYILDTMAEQSAGGTTSNAAKKGAPNYRPKPNEPGYTGPYTTHV